MLPQTLSIADPAPSAVDPAGRTAPTPQPPRPVSLGALDWQENSSVLENALASMPEHSAGLSALAGLVRAHRRRDTPAGIR